MTNVLQRRSNLSTSNSWVPAVEVDDAQQNSDHQSVTGTRVVSTAAERTEGTDWLFTVTVELTIYGRSLGSTFFVMSQNFKNDDVLFSLNAAGEAI